MKNSIYLKGVFNYCDRWCEKCVLADRCKLYAEEQQESKNIKTDEDYIKIISKNLGKSIEMLYEIANEKGIDLDAIEIDEQEAQEEELKFEKARQHRLVELANKYAKNTHQYLKNLDYFEADRNELLNLLEMGVENKNRERIKIINEALQIISWYEFQISIKLESAFLFFPHNPDFEDEIQNMHHTSAKISLIGIEHSMKAWESLNEELPTYEDIFIKQLIHLDKIKKEIHLQFPLLYKYKRPFFND